MAVLPSPRRLSDLLYRRSAARPIFWKVHRAMQRRRIDRAFYVLDGFFLELADRSEPNVTWIVDDLAIGGRILDDEWVRLREAGVGAVVDCRAEGRDPEDVLARLGLSFLHLPTRDAGDFDDAAVDRGAAWIDAQRREGRRVLVHCQAGKGRSVLLGAAALGLRGFHPDEALALIRSRRPIITPTPGQIARLRSFWERVAKWIF